MKNILIFILFILPVLNIQAQVAINEDDSDPDATAALHIKPDAAANPKGILIPNLSETQRNNVPSPATGLMIYNRTNGQVNYYNGSNWMQVANTAGDDGSTNNISGTNNNEVGVGFGIEDPYNCAIVHINANNKGFLISRMAADIAGAPEGTIYYNTTSNKIRVETDGAGTWQNLDATANAAGNSGTGTVTGTLIGSGTVDASAKLEVRSADKGVILPKLTTAQRNAINEVVEGLIIYNTTDHEIQYYVDSKWNTCDFE
jgi:hypothetical protein